MRICFVRLEAGPLFFTADAGGIGGAEVRSTTFARSLAAGGEHEVSFVLGCDRPRPSEFQDGVRLLFLPRRRTSRDRQWGWQTCWQWPADVVEQLGRSLRHRLSSRPPALPFFRELPADVIACFGMQPPMSAAIASGRAAGKQTVLFLIQDLEDDFDRGEGKISARKRRDLAWRTFAIREADRIVAQSKAQQAVLRERFGRESVLIRNPIDTSLVSYARPPVAPLRYALWVGRSDHFSKRSDLCLELARKHPHIPFVVVLNRCDDAAFSEFQRLSPPNVTLLPRVPFDQIDSYFQHAGLLLNTSNREGFPNTFLQAGKHRTPILSLRVDPDGMLSKHGCGSCAGGEMQTMSTLLERFWRGGPEIEAMGRRGRQYVVERHALEGRMIDLKQLLRGLQPAGTIRRAA